MPAAITVDVRFNRAWLERDLRQLIATRQEGQSIADIVASFPTSKYVHVEANETAAPAPAPASPAAAAGEAATGTPAAAGQAS